MEGVDLKLKNRKDLIFILKGLSKRHRRLEKEYKIVKSKALKPEDLEMYVREKEKLARSKKGSMEKILNLS